MRLPFFLLTFYLLLLLGAVTTGLADTMTPKPVVSDEYNHLFYFFHDGRAIRDEDLNKIGLLGPQIGRTFVLLAGVTEYKNMPATLSKLPAAEADLKNLSAYFRQEGFADEIVTLQNSDFTFENLNFFLNFYFPDRLTTYPNSRFVFAFTGHGLTDQKRGYLLLPNASSLSDKAHSIDLNVLKPLFDQVIESARYSLILINSCYAGAFLRRTFGGRYIPLQPGAHAITAGGSTEKTWADPQVGGGSLFFDKFIAGVRGAADTIPPPDPKTGRSGDGIVTVEELFSYLRQEVAIATEEIQNPQLGDLSRDGSTGSYFFVVSNGLTQRPNQPASGTPVSFGAVSPTASDFSVSLVRENGDMVRGRGGASSSKYKINFGMVSKKFARSLVLFVSNDSAVARQITIDDSSSSSKAAWRTNTGDRQEITLQSGSTTPFIVHFSAPESGPQSVNDKIAFLSNNKEIFGVDIVAQVSEAEVKISRSSGLKPSGAGKSFSTPYQFCLGAAPEGYSLVENSIDYSLAGDRRCGSWATCKLVRADNSGVCLEFTLQGHDEAAPEIRESEGLISAKYKLNFVEPKLE